MERFDNFLANSKLNLGALRERKILGMILASSPFTSPTESSDAQESFVLRHDDLDFQKIFTDKHGNVTGIIDWEGCYTASRCVGYSSLPVFLRRNWLPDFTLDRLPHTA
jgi:hypothetical protein